MRKIKWKLKKKPQSSKKLSPRFLLKLKTQPQSLHWSWNHYYIIYIRNFYKSLYTEKKKLIYLRETVNDLFNHENGVIPRTYFTLLTFDRYNEEEWAGNKIPVSWFFLSSFYQQTGSTNCILWPRLVLLKFFENRKKSAFDQQIIRFWQRRGGKF